MTKLFESSGSFISSQGCIFPRCINSYLKWIPKYYVVYYSYYILNRHYTVIRFANSSVKTVLMEKFLQTKSILIDFNYLDLKMARKNMKRPTIFWGHYTHCFPISNASISNSTQNLGFFKEWVLKILQFRKKKSVPNEI